ncbi:MAG: 16S rRNA (adenine(1518)-N(6)/adenine(1519)-N(6))-dimethyltransferase RsmA [Candidatus Zixiibacteriota bacterium]
MRPRKSLSQNFLIDDRAAARIVDRLELSKDDVVLEIGSGRGALTKHLVKKAKKVIAVEIDKRLCSCLEKQLGPKKNLEIVNQDILRLDFKDLLQPESRCKVVGNIPYKITSPLLSLLLKHKQSITLCVLTVQKEVAVRICSVPGSRDWSPLSIAVQLFSDVQILFHLKPSSFFPQPRVDSSVVKIVFLPKPRVPLPDERLFFKVVRAAFGQRRKILLNSLASNLDLPKKELEVILNTAGIDPKRRAETLCLSEFAILSSAIHRSLN